MNTTDVVIVELERVLRIMENQMRTNHRPEERIPTIELLIRARIGDLKNPSARFVGYQQLHGGEYEAMYEVSGLPGYSGPTTLLERTLLVKGIAVPAHPTHEQWSRYPLRNVMNGGVE